MSKKGRKEKNQETPSVNRKEETQIQEQGQIINWEGITFEKNASEKERGEEVLEGPKELELVWLDDGLLEEEGDVIIHAQDLFDRVEDDTDSEEPLESPADTEALPVKAEGQESVDFPSDEEDDQSAAIANLQALSKHSSRKTAAARSPRAKSARPGKISYVSLPDQDIYVAPLNKSPKKTPWLKILGAALGAVGVMAVTAYAGISYYYTDHFFRGTSINGIDCSDKTAYEVEELMAHQYDGYSISVASRGNETETIAGSSIDYHYLSNGEVLSLLQDQKPYAWIRGLFSTTSHTISRNVTFDKALLRSQLRALTCAQEENQIPPQDAYVTLEGNEFTIVPETEGSQLKVKEAYQALDEAISSGEDAVDFTSDPEVYQEAQIKQGSPQLKSMLDAYNNYATASITYTFGNEEVVLDGETLKTWLEFDDKGELIQGDGGFSQHIADYVAELAAEHDTVGTYREFTATSGRTVYVYGSAYGWMIDQEAERDQLEAEIASGAQVVREPLYAMTANAYGYNDLGDTYIEVDMGYQHMYYYRNGVLIFGSDFVSGNINYPDRATPEGIYTLYFKQSPAVLRGRADENGNPEYETPVTFWMPFNGGVGFHDAEWQPYFGGDRYIEGGSHGCINLPYESAAELYSIIEYGVPIICFY